jgi:hypothetical protein
MRVWINLAYLSLAASLVSLGIANASWLLQSPTAGLSPRAYAGGAAIALCTPSPSAFDRAQRT